MRIKKAFLGTSLITLSTAAPIAVAVSCGKDEALNGVSKWSTSIRVGQEYSMNEQKPDLARRSSFGFSLTQEIAEKTMKLQMWLEGHGFTLWSNSTSIFNQILSNLDMKKVARYDELLSNEKRTKTEEDEFDLLNKKIQEWCKQKVEELKNENKWQMQDLFWTSNGKVVLDGWKRKYKITKIQDTIQGIAIQTTLSTAPPEAKIDGYIVRSPITGKQTINSNTKSVSVDGATEDLKKIWSKIHDKNHSNDGVNINGETFINEHAILKRFIGVKLSNRVIDFKDPNGKTIKQKFEDALKSLAKLNESEFRKYVTMFGEIEEYFHNTVMKYIEKNNHDITKLYANEEFTYSPKSIIKDLQEKAKSNPKLLGNVDPKNLTWLK